MAKYKLDKTKDKYELDELKEDAKSELCYTFAVRLRECFIKSGKNQEELANEANCSTASISAYLKAKAEPKMEVLLKIAEAFNVSIDYLLGGSESKKATNKEINKRIGLDDDAIDILEKVNKAQKDTFYLLNDFISSGDIFSIIYLITTIAYIRSKPDDTLKSTENDNVLRLTEKDIEEFTTQKLLTDKINKKIEEFIYSKKTKDEIQKDAYKILNDLGIHKKEGVTNGNNPKKGQ